MLNGKKIIRVGLFSIFASLFCVSNYSEAKLYEVNTTYQYNYNILNGDFEITSDLNFPYEKPIQFAGNQCNATTIFWYDKKLGFITQRSFNTANCNKEAGQVVQGFFTKICKTTYLNNNDQALILGRNFNCPSNGRVDIEEFYNTTGTLTSIAFMQEYYANYPRNFCFNFQDINTSYCVLTNLRNSDARPNQYSGFDFTTVNNYEDIINYESPSPNSPRTADTPTGPETTTIIGECPTINEILNTYSSNYNTGICYSSTRLLTQTGIVNTTQQSIFELYPTFTGWLEDYNYYRQYCENVPTSVCREAFSGNEIKWSLLNKTPENNPIGVYQYCHMQLNIQDKNATTCVLSTGAYFATGVDQAIEEEIQGNQSVLDIMLNSFNNLKDELPSFESGTVFDEFLEEGETWKDGFKLDIFKTFLELWSKITSIFIFRHQYDGIIPTYITSIIMIILLFKILKK